MSPIRALTLCALATALGAADSEYPRERLFQNYPGLVEVTGHYSSSSGEKKQVHGRGYVVAVEDAKFLVTAAHVAWGEAEHDDERELEFDFASYDEDGTRYQIRATSCIADALLDLFICKLDDRDSRVEPFATMQPIKLQAESPAEIVMVANDRVPTTPIAAFDRDHIEDMFPIGITGRIPAYPHEAKQSPYWDWDFVAAISSLIEKPSKLYFNRLFTSYELGNFENSLATHIVLGMSGSPVINHVKDNNSGDLIPIVIGTVSATSNAFRESWLLPWDQVVIHVMYYRDLIEQGVLEEGSGDDSFEVAVFTDVRWYVENGLLFRRGYSEALGLSFSEVSFQEEGSATVRQPSGGGIRSDGGGGIRSDGGGGIRSDGGDLGSFSQDPYEELGIRPGMGFFANDEESSGEEINALAFEIRFPNGTTVLTPADWPSTRFLEAYTQMREMDGPNPIAIDIVGPATTNPLRNIIAHLDRNLESEHSASWHEELTLESIAPIDYRHISALEIDIQALPNSREPESLQVDITFDDVHLSFRLNKDWSIEGASTRDFRYIVQLKDKNSDHEFRVDLSGILMHNIGRTPLSDDYTVIRNPLHYMRFQIAKEDGKEYTAYHDTILDQYYSTAAMEKVILELSEQLDRFEESQSQND